MCVSLGVLSGCTGRVTLKDNEKNELQGSITVWSSKENLDLLKLSANNYNKQHGKVSINIVEVGSNELVDKLKLAAISKENLPDILCVEDEYVQDILKQQAVIFEDTGDDLKKDNYLKYKIDNLTFEGKVYGFPLSSIPAVMVFRSDVIEKNSVNLEYIKTWEDYIALNSKSALPFGEEKLFRAFLNQLGGSYFDKEKNIAISSEKEIKSAELLKKLYSSGAVRNIKSFEEIKGLLEKGEIDSALISTEMLSKIYKEAPELKAKLLMIKPPAFEEGGNQAINLGGGNLILINSSKNKDIALDFCRFSSENRDNLKAAISTLGEIPAYSYYYDEKDFADKRMLELVKDTYAINYTENFSKVKENINLAITNIILKGQDVKNILDELQKNLSIQIK